MNDKNQRMSFTPDIKGVSTSQPMSKSMGVSHLLHMAFFTYDANYDSRTLCCNAHPAF